MTLQFTKMHGLGNDFIVVDATKYSHDFSTEKVQLLADRRTGIGFDQLLIIEPATSQEHDFVYRIFNADGQEVEQCGNGARCVAHYIFTQNLSLKKDIVLATLSGRIALRQEQDGQITVNMGKPRFSPETIPFITDKQQQSYELNVAHNAIQFGVVSIGNPHAVLVVQDVFRAPVQQVGQALQHHPAFPNQVNVGFMEVTSKDHVRLRVYERGVGETRSCGSGACAAVVIGRQTQDLNKRVTVQLPGGSLSVYWEGNEGDVYLTGPAAIVYKGETSLV